MSRITITLQDDETEALHKLAQQEQRTPRDQAALVICQELERYGFLPGKQTTPKEDYITFEQGTESWDKVIHVRAPSALIEAIEKEASQRLTNKSTVVRQILGCVLGVLPNKSYPEKWEE